MPLVEWGEPLTGFWTYEERKPKDSEVEHEEKVETTHTIVQRKPLTVAEMEMVVSEFVARMKDEYPEHDVKYVAIEKKSPLKMRVQLEENSPIPVATILEIIATVVIAAVIVKFGWEVWQIIESVAEAIKSFGGDPAGYASKNPVKAGLIIGVPVVGAVAVKEIFFD